MTQRLFASVLALSVSVALMSVPAHAWFGKKHKDEAPAAPAATQAAPTQPAPSPSVSPEPSPASSGLPQVQLQSPISDEANNLKVEDPIESTDLPPDKTFVAIDDPTNPLGITVSARNLNDCATLITQKKYKEASVKLSPLKDWLVDATEAHMNLYKTLKSIPSAQVQAELEKQLALQFALLRDKAFFQLGMLAIGQNDYNNGVRHLSKVIQSQPRSPMGAQAYEVLQKIGFTEKIQIKEDKKAN